MLWVVESFCNANGLNCNWSYFALSGIAALNTSVVVDGKNITIKKAYYVSDIIKLCVAILNDITRLCVTVLDRSANGTTLKYNTTCTSWHRQKISFC